jgi:pimeloyl-ACP methyl ester carboxylesterase
MRGQDVETNGIRIHYRETGDGPALLLIHGFTVAGQFWDSMVPFFAEDHRVIVVDLPGHGRSTGHAGPYRYRQVAADMYGLLDHLGLDQVRAMGHSAGGNTLVHMATQQPERIESMVLIAGGHRLLTSAREMGRQATATYEGFPYRELGLAMQPGGDAQAKALVAALHGLFDDYEDMSFTPERLSRIRARTLLIWGDRDPFYPIEIAAEMYRAIPNAALWVVPFQGHLPLWPELGGSVEATRESRDVIRRFLNDAGSQA